MPNIVWIWLAAFVIFLIIEIFMPSMMFVGFALGALITGIIAFFVPEAYYWQIGIFIIISIALLPFTKKFAKRITNESPSLSNIDAMINQVVLVVEKIDPSRSGQIKIEGEIWRAVADEEIGIGEKVSVISISGNKVHVKKVEN